MTNPSGAGRGYIDLDNCQFTSNVLNNEKISAKGGAAIYAGQSITTTITSSTFSHNSAAVGAAIYCDSGASFSVLNSMFNYNSATDGSPAWCASDCAFVASKVRQYGNKDEKNSGRCPGL